MVIQIEKCVLNIEKGYMEEFKRHSYYERLKDGSVFCLFAHVSNDIFT